VGLSDYAYANAFLDQFAALRENRRQAGECSGRTLAINWPAWAEGGMQMTPQTIELLYSTWGMRLLEREQGWLALLNGLSTDESHFVVVNGNKKKLCKRMAAFHSEPKKARPAAGGPTISRDEILAELTQQVSELLKLPVEKLTPEEDLTEFGFESITLTEFANDLNNRYSLELTPATFFKYTTLGGLADHLVDEYSDALTGTAPAADEAPQAASMLPKWQQATESTATPTTKSGFGKEKVAIIGMAGMLPGSKDLEAFWQHLKNADDLIVEIPAERWDWRQYYGDHTTDHTKSNSKWGGFIADADKFDAEFFKLSRREAEMMDPQHRILLQNVWHTVEDAGYRVSDLADESAGIFIGAQFNDYQALLAQRLDEAIPQAVVGNSHAVLVNRISYLLNFS
ncbi:MAG: hypothetical protein GY731_03435, partial [Gammaproteobacteria bacterium]|nr:hypothetical protein [Gammaproteobacteria bacterium]